MYPDCPSERGRRYIKLLSGYVKEGGGEGILLFIAALQHVKAFRRINPQIRSSTKLLRRSNHLELT